MTTPSPLSTDFYQLTMAQGYWKSNLHNTKAAFQLFFRTAPFQQSFAIAAGLQTAIEFLESWCIEDDDLAYLSTLQKHGKPIFYRDFLKELRDLRFSGDVFGIPEGSLAFPHEPLLRLEVPLWLGQLLETPLLTIINYQTLIASKAARLCKVAQGKSVLDFGLRRAQGPNGGLMGSRAAYIGGVTATSNVLAGKTYGIPVAGTHAHSWISAFENELSAFRAYAQHYPDDCVLLVDTYHSITGIQNAITVGLELKQNGFILRGIRLDSGNLLELSKTARHMLDQAGLTETHIIASNALNEQIIADLIEANAPIDAWGVGTQLITAYDEPALNGVYKLTSLYTDGSWQHKIKCSDEIGKMSWPGRHQVRRFLSGNHAFHHDVMYDVTAGCASQDADHTLTSHDLLEPIFQNGMRTYTSPDIHHLREHTQRSMQHSSLLNPMVVIDPALAALQKELLYMRD